MSLSFVYLNGIAVPIKEGSSTQKIENIGARKRSYSGAMLTTRRARKRSWVMKTPILSRQEASGIEAVVAGTGDSYDCEWQTGLSPSDTDDRYSAKGAGNQATTYGVAIPGVAGDGYPIYDWDEDADASYLSAYHGSTASFSTQTAVGNLLTASQSEGSATSGFTETGTGSTIAVSAEHYVFGSNCIANHMDAGAGPRGVSTAAATTTILPETTYTISGYVFCPDTDAEVTARFYTNIGLVEYMAFTVTKGRWVRFQKSFESQESANTVYVYLSDETEDEHTNYIDGLKVEPGQYATAFSVGQVAADTDRQGGPIFDASFITSPEFTIGCRVRVPTLILSGDRPLFQLGLFNAAGDAYYRALSLYITAAGVLTAELLQAESGDAVTAGTVLLSKTLSPTWGAPSSYDSVAVVIKSRSSTAVGANPTMELFFTNLAGAQSSEVGGADWRWPPTAPAVIGATAQEFELGSMRTAPSTLCNEIEIDDVYIVNAALTSTQLGEIGTNKQIWGQTPALRLHGRVEDGAVSRADGDPGLAVEGRITGVKYQSAQTSDIDSFEPESRVLDVTLEEV